MLTDRTCLQHDATLPHFPADLASLLPPCCNAADAVLYIILQASPATYLPRMPPAYCCLSAVLYRAAPAARRASAGWQGVAACAARRCSPLSLTSHPIFLGATLSAVSVRHPATQRSAPQHHPDLRALALPTRRSWAASAAPSSSPASCLAPASAWATPGPAALSPRRG
jgi:hypothetical protein